MAAAATCFAGLLMFVLLQAPAARAAPHFMLVENGAPRCTMVLAADADERMRQAADDLQDHLHRMSGAELPRADALTEGPDIAFQLLPAFPPPPVPVTREDTWPDGYVIFLSGDDLVLAAHRPEGVANAAYGLLEDHLGCHWFRPGPLGEHVPRRKTVSVGIADGCEVVRPTFEFRSPWYNRGVFDQWPVGEKAVYERWRLRNRGGGMRTAARHHWRVIYPVSLQREKPDLAPMIDGRRVPGGGQICMAHPEAADIAARYFIRLFEARPELDGYSFSQNDGGGWCTCDACAAFGANNGQRMLRLANAVAERVARVRPEKSISFMCYAGTIDPPDVFIAGHRNLTPVICSIHMEQVKPKTDPACGEYRAKVERWMSMLPRAWSRDYIGQYPGPWPLFHKLETEQDCYRGLGYTGILTEYLGRHLGTDTTMWAAHRIAWDGALRVDDLLDTFYSDYYGRAGHDLRRFDEKLERHMLSIGGSGDVTEAPRLYPLALIDEGVASADEALDRVGDDALRRARLRERVNWLRLTRAWLDAWHAGTAYRKPARAALRAAAVQSCERFLALREVIAKEMNLGSRDRGFIESLLEVLTQAGPVFTSPGPFHYRDTLNDGGAARVHSLRMTGFTDGRYGLCVPAGGRGEIVYRIEAKGGLRFQEVRLTQLYLYLSPGVTNAIAVSVDEGEHWITAIENAALQRGEVSLTPHVGGASVFLLRIAALNQTDGLALAVDQWALEGTIAHSALPVDGKQAN